MTHFLLRAVNGEVVRSKPSGPEYTERPGESGKVGWGNLDHLNDTLLITCS